MLGETENQFSFTRAASSTWAGQKSKFLSVGSLHKTSHGLVRGMVIAIVGLGLFIAALGASGLYSSCSVSKAEVWCFSSGTTVLGYDWLTEDEFLYVSHQHGASRVVSVNISNRVSKVMKLPTDALNHPPLERRNGLDWQLSFDRKWLLIPENAGYPRALYAVNLFVRRVVRLPISGDEGYVCCLPRETGWVEFANKANTCEARIARVSDTNNVETIELPLRISIPIMIRPKDASLLTLTSHDNALKLIQLHLWPKVSLYDGVRIIVNDAQDIIAPLFSPDGRRLAWISERQAGVPRLELRGRFPFARLYKKTVWKLHVANLDDQSSRELVTGGEEDLPSCIRWRPRSDSLSFLSHQKVYLFRTD